MFSNELGRLLSDVVLTLGVTFSADDPYNYDGGSPVLLVNVCRGGTRGYKYNECTREGVWAVFIDGT